MSAKSLHSLRRGFRAGKFAPRAPGRLSAWVLIAGLTVLGLIAHNWHPTGAVTEVRDVPVEVFPMAAAEIESDDGRHAVPEPDEGGHRALARFLAKKYRVSQDITFDWVKVAHVAGHQLGLDPLLIIAVIAVESRFNPVAESVAGAQGLMQVIPKYHSEKFEAFGGERVAFDPHANILVGSRVLKEYLALTGNLGIALQMYAGALNDDQDQYTDKVMAEMQRLRQVANRFKLINSQVQRSSSGRQLGVQ